MRVVISGVRYLEIQLYSLTFSQKTPEYIIKLSAVKKPHSRIIYINEWYTDALTIPENAVYYIIDRTKEAEYSLTIFGECHLLKLCLGEKTHHTICAEIKANSIFTLDTIILAESSKIELSSHLVWNMSHARTNILALAKENANLFLSGNMFVDTWLSGYYAHVRQQSILLWNSAFIRGIPKLSIGSGEGDAWHSCTMSQIPEEDIFYMESHGINRSHAIRIIVEGMLEKRLQCFVWLRGYKELRSTLLRTLQKI